MLADDLTHLRDHRSATTAKPLKFLAQKPYEIPAMKHRRLLLTNLANDLFGACSC